MVKTVIKTLNESTEECKKWAKASRLATHVYVHVRSARSWRDGRGVVSYKLTKQERLRLRYIFENHLIPVEQAYYHGTHVDYSYFVNIYFCRYFIFQTLASLDASNLSGKNSYFHDSPIALLPDEDIDFISELSSKAISKYKEKYNKRACDCDRHPYKYGKGNTIGGIIQKIGNWLAQFRKNK